VDLEGFDRLQCQPVIPAADYGRLRTPTLSFPPSPASRADATDLRHLQDG
jgi:hypothetical protein